MPQAERQRVWKGELKKTSGGLRKQDLMKNSRGKIVSRKKSEAAKKNKDKNNLAGWLRQKGEQFMSKGVTAEHVVRKDKRKKKLEKLSLPGGTVEPVAKKKLDSKKTIVVLPKPKPKPVVQKPKPKPVVQKPKPKPKPKKSSGPKITKLEPIKPGEDKDLSKVSVGNILPEVDLYTKQVNGLINTFSKEKIIEFIGQPPAGFKWPKKS